MAHHQRRTLRRPLLVVVWALLLLALAACRTPSPVPAPRGLGGLLIKSEPADAAVYLDDRFQGSATAISRQPLQVPEGSHRLEIRKDGYFPHFAEITVVKGVRQQLEIKLRKEPF